MSDIIQMNKFWLWLNKSKFSPWRPKVTQSMKAKGLTWAFCINKDGSTSWREVCNFCGGNCGQCGITGRIGNVPFNFNRIVKNSGMKKGVYGFSNRGGKE